MKNLVFFFTLTSFCSAWTQSFTGTVVYSAEAAGEPEGSKLFNEYQADQITVSWSDEGFEQREPKGMNAGKVIYKLSDDKALYCQASTGEVIEASVQNMAKTDPEVKKFMPHLFTYEISATGEKTKIAGYECEKYEIKKSGFLKAGAKGVAWIAKGLKLPPSQFQFETEWKRIMSAMPLQFAFKEGAILKLFITEKSLYGDGDVTVTYLATEVKEEFFPPDFLKVPEGYSKK